MPAHLLAHLVRATSVVDWAYRKFEGIRRELVLSFGSDQFFEAYNDLCYARTPTYRTGSTSFRTALFTWEEATIDRWFPKPPATVLVGAAGGGREALALAARGFEVVAFEPSDLVVELRNGRPAGVRLEILRGRYRDLPRLRTVDDEPVSLEARAPFSAGIVGWGSFSHLPADADRIATLQAYRRLVAGPVLVSYFGRVMPSEPPPPPTGLRRLLLEHRGERRPGGAFSIDVGLFRQISPDDIRVFAAQAGYDAVHVQTGTEWPHAVLRPAGGG